MLEAAQEASLQNPRRDKFTNKGGSWPSSGNSCLKKTNDCANFQQILLALTSAQIKRDLKQPENCKQRIAPTSVTIIRIMPYTASSKKQRINSALSNSYS